LSLVAFVLWSAETADNSYEAATDTFVVRDGKIVATDKTDIGTTPSWTWADIEDVLSAEWEIGGSAIPTDAIRGLVADE
jgi:hypothetical protein